MLCSMEAEGGRAGDRHRAAILQAASELVHEVPIHEVTVRRIAERAQLNPSLVYRYFGKLDNLFRAVSDLTAVAIREAVADASSPVDVVLAAAEFYRANPAVWLRIVEGVADGADMAATLGPESGFLLRVLEMVAGRRGVDVAQTEVRADVLMALYLVGGQLAIGPYAAGRLGLDENDDTDLDARLRHELSRLLER